MKVDKLIGKTLMQITGTIGDDTMIFETIDGEKYQMFHIQDCCENVRIEEIVGDIQDLIGSPILKASEDTNTEDTFGRIEYPESFTWTFYNLATIKGYVTIRWLGESNGYYSESVEFDYYSKSHS